jgi:hypothetical protein
MGEMGKIGDKGDPPVMLGKRSRERPNEMSDCSLWAEEPDLHRETEYHLTSVVDVVESEIEPEPTVPKACLAGGPWLVWVYLSTSLYSLHIDIGGMVTAASTEDKVGPSVVLAQYASAEQFRSAMVSWQSDITGMQEQFQQTYNAAVGGGGLYPACFIFAPVALLLAWVFARWLHLLAGFPELQEWRTFAFAACPSMYALGFGLAVGQKLQLSLLLPMGCMAWAACKIASQWWAWLTVPDAACPVALRRLLARCVALPEPKLPPTSQSTEASSDLSTKLPDELLADHLEENASSSRVSSLPAFSLYCLGLYLAHRQQMNTYTLLLVTVLVPLPAYMMATKWWVWLTYPEVCTTILLSWLVLIFVSAYSVYHFLSGAYEVDRAMLQLCDLTSERELLLMTHQELNLEYLRVLDGVQHSLRGEKFGLKLFSAAELPWGMGVRINVQFWRVVYPYCLALACAGVAMWLATTHVRSVIDGVRARQAEWGRHQIRRIEKKEETPVAEGGEGRVFKLMIGGQLAAMKEHKRPQEAEAGLGRIVAFYYRSSTLHQIR